VQWPDLRLASETPVRELAAAVARGAGQCEALGISGAERLPVFSDEAVQGVRAPHAMRPQQAGRRDG